ncbi:hypothetical protein BofuT4_uP024940.1 [Botrytis cinerea T4]|uniref:Uncharacterized protein n=1 Tax=Botryotinia fuckeliana (strain T4) TaxID=999810 RepID=G2YE97_BOTF4|nr:hypothetical protein BofuT4_uP024940.1 [Botrytis cinerea T4]
MAVINWKLVHAPSNHHSQNDHPPTETRAPEYLQVSQSRHQDAPSLSTRNVR